MKFFLFISRILVGVVFVFSGFVKAVDPSGSAYKFSDYFSAFGLPFLEPLTIPLVIILSSAEFLIGISLLTGNRFRLGAWGLFIFMVFFTILTFIIALTNPVTDCGCFGDAIIMTNWQTFYKNLILLPFVLLIFYNRNKQFADRPVTTEWILIGCFGILIIGFQVINLRHLPPLDFRPYHIGSYIPDKMVIPEGEKPDEYKTFLYYEKDGNIEEFTEDNFPWEDTTWTFVESKHVLVAKGFEPPIHDFTITDRDGYDLTDHILADNDYSYLLISSDIEKANHEALLKANDMAAYCMAGNCSFYCLTSSTQEDAGNVAASLGIQFEFYTTDEITLKTIIRSNPGLLLLKEGTIIDKWHFRDFIPVNQLNDNMLPGSIDRQRKLKERNYIFLAAGLLLLFFVSIGVFKIRPEV